MITNVAIVHTVLLLNVWLGAGYLMMRGLLRIPSVQHALAEAWRLKLARFFFDLAIMTYNQGEDEIHRLIKQTGQSNAWQLIRSPLANPELKRYLPSVYAAVMIMRHPELI